VVNQFLERPVLLTLFSTLEHEAIENLLQNWVHLLENTNFVACSALKFQKFDVGIILLGGERSVAIVAGELMAVGTLEQLRLDHHAERALEVFWEGVQVVVLVVIIQQQLHCDLSLHLSIKIIV
jgi:hypothetical protein